MNENPSLDLLTVNNLNAGYSGFSVLRDVNLHVSEGECVGLFGHNGMGKSTLLRTLIGLIRPLSGSIEFDGQDITRLPTWKRARLGMGYLPQGRGIFPGLSVSDNIGIAYNPDTRDKDEMSALDGAVARFPTLEPLIKQAGGTLSGGEQQILALARALTADPVMLLLDEPTEGIQPSIVMEIAIELSAIAKNTGLTILMVEQNIDFLNALADRILHIENGIIVEQERRPADSSVKPKTQTPVSASDSELEKTFEGTNEQILEKNMGVSRPTIEQMQQVSSDLHFQMDKNALTEYLDLAQSTIDAYDIIDAMPDELPEVKYPRTSGYIPAESENPLNAWYVKCDISGSPDGLLRGKPVVLKDTICLSGVRMMNGASIMDGYVPDIDASIVTRILDAGGKIAGKARCEYLCLSGGSHTSTGGPVKNPWRTSHSSGGSSSGCGALVGSGEVPMAIGGDQGGSIRIPSSWSGCYGMKPTHGLVPYTGVMAIESTIDHVGPMTTTVQDNALLLEAIAGLDEGLDPRQYITNTCAYAKDMLQGIAGLRIGVVNEGFGWPNSELDVDDTVHSAIDLLRSMGATVEEVSIPLHRQGAAIWTPIALEGLTDFMMHGNAFGTNYRGLFLTGMIDHYANWRNRADELSPSLKICMMIGEYFIKHHRGRYYGKSQNISRRLRLAYDDAFRQFDLLAMPTIQMKATPLPPPDAPLSLYIQRAFEMIVNTAPFNCTGHPAMSIPCGLRDGLPVGMMLIGRHLEESTIYRAAYEFEQSVNWQEI